MILLFIFYILWAASNNFSQLLSTLLFSSLFMLCIFRFSYFSVMLWVPSSYQVFEYLQIDLSFVLGFEIVYFKTAFLFYL